MGRGRRRGGGGRARGAHGAEDAWRGLAALECLRLCLCAAIVLLHVLLPLQYLLFRSGTDAWAASAWGDRSGAEAAQEEAALLRHTPRGTLVTRVEQEHWVLKSPRVLSVLGMGTQVDAFFALAGFLAARKILKWVAAWQAQAGSVDRDNALVFSLRCAGAMLVSRVFRMWPAMVVSLALSMFVFGERLLVSAQELLDMFFFRMNASTSMGDVVGRWPMALIITWSNSVDVQCCVVLAVLLPLLAHLRLLHPVTVGLPVVLVSVVYRFARALSDPMSLTMAAMASVNRGATRFSLEKQALVNDMYGLWGPNGTWMVPPTTDSPLPDDWRREFLRPQPVEGAPLVYGPHIYAHTLSRCAPFFLGAAAAVWLHRARLGANAKNKNKKTMKRTVWHTLSRWAAFLVFGALALAPYVPAASRALVSGPAMAIAGTGLRDQSCEAAAPQLKAIIDAPADAYPAVLPALLGEEGLRVPSVLWRPQETADFLLHTACNPAALHRWNTSAQPLNMLEREAYPVTGPRSWVPLLFYANPASKLFYTANYKHLFAPAPVDAAAAPVVQYIDMARHGLDVADSALATAVIDEDEPNVRLLAAPKAMVLITALLRAVVGLAWAVVVYLLATSGDSASSPTQAGSNNSKGSKRSCGSSWLSFFGALTYPVYILHIVFLHALAMKWSFMLGWLQPSPGNRQEDFNQISPQFMCQLFAAGLVLSFLAAAVCHVVVERPVQAVGAVVLRYLDPLNAPGVSSTTKDESETKKQQ